MTQIYGPFDQGDFRTMQMLRTNIRWYQTQDASKFGEAANQHRSQLKEFFRKVA